MNYQFRSLLVVVPFLLGSCNSDKEQIDALQNEIRSVSEQQAQALSEANRLKMQYNSLSKERDSLKEEKAKVEAELEQARKAFEQIQKEFASYRSQYKLSMKTRGLGMSLGDFLVDGQTYKNAKVREVTDEMLSVLHDSGTKKFSWDALPESIRRVFGFEKPGEYVTISLPGSRKPDSPLSIEERIARHDQEVQAIQEKINQLKREATENRRTSLDMRSTRSKSNIKKLPTVEIERAINAFDARQITIQAEIQTLETQQYELLKQDPRRKRF